MRDRPVPGGMRGVRMRTLLAICGHACCDESHIVCLVCLPCVWAHVRGSGRERPRVRARACGLGRARARYSSTTGPERPDYESSETGVRGA